MSPNRRIALNILATYGRSLYVIVIGLICGRWALMALGQVDYGLYGLVGGLTAFVSFFNELLSMSIGRFYAVAVGAARKQNVEDGVEECRKWFNTAFLIHSTIPFVLLVVGYPLGAWLVCRFLSIPSDRIISCLWVWRFTCVTCFVGMINVPFRAMYGANQEIAELTIYGFATTTFNVLVLSYMVSHPAVWIVKYAIWMMFLSVVPQMIITYRAFLKYPACRFRAAYLYNGQRIKDIFNYAFARFWTALSGMVSAQGNAILVNKYLGPALNASMTIGTSVASKASTLSGSLSGAFWPAIANKAGEGDEEGVRRFSFRTCRLGSFLVLIFAIPLVLEVDEVMRLWLKTPPSFASIICLTILVDTVLERMSEGYWMAIMGLGRRVGLYSAWVSVAGFSRLLMAWLTLALGFGIYGLCCSIIFARFVAIAVRLVLGRILVGMSAQYWIKSVFCPILLLAGISLLFGFTVRLWLKEASLVRIMVTTFFCESVLFPSAWKGVLCEDERAYLVEKVKKIFRRKSI